MFEGAKLAMMAKMAPWKIWDRRSAWSFGERLVLAVCLGALACGGSEKPQCGARAWSGRCKLQRVVLAREVEMPIPHVVLEAWYEPVPNVNDPNFTPSAMAVEFATRSRFEANLRDHLDKYPEVTCSVGPPAPGKCAQGEFVVDVARFTPPAESFGFEQRSSQGCAQIEDAAARDQLPEIGRDSGSLFREHFYFEPGSAALNEAARSLAGQAASSLQQDTTLECIAVVGQVAPGEPPTLAAERARAVQQALLDQGVDHKRLMAITATVSVYGDDTEKQLEAGKLRRVMLRTILRRSPNPEPAPATQ